jgi:hypothetical protein
MFLIILLIIGHYCPKYIHTKFNESCDNTMQAKELVDILESNSCVNSQ